MKTTQSWPQNFLMPKQPIRTRRARISRSRQRDLVPASSLVEKEYDEVANQSATQHESSLQSCGGSIVPELLKAPWGAAVASCSPSNPHPRLELEALNRFRPTMGRPTMLASHEG